MNFPPLVKASAELSNEEVARYSRHILLPEFGIERQKILKSSKVLVIGAGGLGSPALLYLAAAGVGVIGIVDFDVVDVSNLQRQVIHGVSDVDTPKTTSARKRILDINPHVEVQIHEERLIADNILDIISQYDLILDGTDNFPTRYLVNDACVIAGKPYIWGSIYRFEGQVSVFWEQAPDGKGFNYRDLYAEPPPPEFAPSCSEGGVLGVLCAAIGSVMATEAIKLLTGIGEPLLGRLLIYDALDMTYRELPIQKSNQRAAITQLVDVDAFCGIKDSVIKESVATIDVQTLKTLMDHKAAFKQVDVREKAELDIVSVEESIHIPKGTLSKKESLASLDKDDNIIVMCKSGARSLQAVNELREQGFNNVKNLEGGILAWIREVNPQLPNY